MLIKFLSLILVLSLCAVSNAKNSTFQKGMAFGSDVAAIPFDSPGALQSLKDLKSTGANSVCIVFSWFQDTINSTVIYPVIGSSPTIPAIAVIVSNATALGFKVVLKPHVDVRDGTWRAWIGTYFTDEDWDKWFTSYYEYYLKFAELAQLLGVAIYSVGVEMITASAHANPFIKLVGDVRKVFTGNVTYSANWGTKLQSVLPPTRESAGASWGGEIDQITWINVLDYIGLDAYYYLTDELYPTEQDLIQAWAPIATHVKNISQFWNKSVIFTEIGYRSIDGAAVHPGWWNISATSNITQQAICYKAVFDSLMNETWWEGIYWWAWSTDPNAGGIGDTDYTPQNKQETLDILQQYYSIL